MLIETEKMIPITKLQKHLTQKIRDISNNNDIAFILKNNHAEAVILSFDDYKYLKEIEEIFEQFEIDDLIKKRLENYNRKNNVDWKKIKK